MPKNGAKENDKIQLEAGLNLTLKAGIMKPLESNHVSLCREAAEKWNECLVTLPTDDNKHSAAQMLLQLLQFSFLLLMSHTSEKPVCRRRRYSHFNLSVSPLLSSLKYF